MNIIKHHAIAYIYMSNLSITSFGGKKSDQGKYGNDLLLDYTFVKCVSKYYLANK